VEVSFSEVKQDGSIGKTIAVTKQVFIGRENENNDLSYPDDALLSKRHASLAVRQGKLVLKDAESQNGTFVKLRQDAELRPGDVFLLGRELFRFKPQSL
jgi:pSer/pThr/pTyr-binding forkhead associated (FHA) protein